MSDEKPVTFPIPDLAKTAMSLVQKNFARECDAIGRQTVAAMGLDAEAFDYSVDFSQGVVTQTPKKAKA